MNQAMALTLGGIIEDNAYHYPNDIAYIQDERRVTHRQFANRAHQLASALEKNGLQRQDRVAILSMNNIEFTEVYGACELAGYITATINWRLAPAETSWIIQDCSPRVLVFEAQYLDLVETLRAELICIEKFICIGASAEWAEEYENFLANGSPAGASFRAVPEDIAYLIYTSGTTGRPKGCILGQSECAYLGQLLNGEVAGVQTDRTLLVMPLFHIGAKALQLSTHWRGGSVVLHRQFEAEQVAPTIAKEEITILHLAPTMFQMMMEDPMLEQHNLSSLRVILYAAAPMPTTVLKRGLKMLGNVFLQQYGQTEGCGTALQRHQHRPNGGPRDLERLGSVGQAMRNVELRIVDDEGNECPTGVAGEVTYRTGAMFRGYWNNSKATLETLIDGWCHSGDIGKLDEEGFLYLVDRKKDMIISGGENIYSREVEEALVQHPAVSEAAVIGLPDPKWGEAVCAVIVLRNGMTATDEDIIEHSRTLIASYKKPKSVFFVDSLPKLPSGKISKVELRKRFHPSN